MSKENSTFFLIKLTRLQIHAMGFFYWLLALVVLVAANQAYAQVVVNDSTSQNELNLDAVTSTQSLQREAEQLYDQGLRAYLQEDYVTAHSTWLMAARNKHAKSQFNLALMHERQQVPNEQSSKQEALALYKQAANANYQPAYVYWARLVEKDNPELAQRIRNNTLKKPQQNQIKTSPSAAIGQAKNIAPATAKTPSADKMIAKPPAHLLTKTPLYRRDNWILQQADDRWTVQLLAYRNETKLLDFIDRFSLVKDSAYFTEHARGIYWYKLIYGVYASKAEAAAARSKLPQTVRNEGPCCLLYTSPSPRDRG